MKFDIPPRAENLENENKIDPLLRATIYDESAKELRRKVFDAEWQNRYQRSGTKEGYFQTNEQESPFGEFSSRGWKVHIVFPKGKEKEFAQILYENGLYFKLESGIGTYFNGLKESGATIYIGSYDNMEAVADLIENSLGNSLGDGLITKVGEKIIHKGSGSDIEIRPKITARFDVAKTQFGWLEGNKKYAEKGLPSWTGLGGIPILKKYEKQVSEVEQNWNRLLQEQRDIYYQHLFKRVYEESRDELIQDFGKEFLEGKKANNRAEE